MAVVSGVWTMHGMERDSYLRNDFHILQTTGGTAMILMPDGKMGLP